MAKVIQEKLILKHVVRVNELKNDVLGMELPIHGLIDAKEGKDTHVIAYSKSDVVRSDGKIVSVQVSAWYK